MVEAFFKVISSSGTQHKLVRIFQPSGPDVVQAHEVDEGSHERFHGGLPELFHLLYVWGLQALVHLIIQRLAGGFCNFFVIRTSTNTRCSEGALTTLFGTAAVLLFVVALLVLVRFLVR